MPAHEYYTELCALAASAQLSPEEYAELTAHAEYCQSCRQAIADFQQVICRALPQSRSRISVVRETFRAQPNPGSRGRFLRRARIEGIHISDQAESSPAPAWRDLALRRVVPQLAVLALLVVVAIGAYKVLQAKQSSSLSSQRVAAVSEVEQLRRENNSLREDLRQSREFANARTQELAKSQEAQASLSQQVSGLMQMIDTMQRKAESVGGLLQAAKSKNADLDARLQSDARVLADLRGEVERLRSAKTDSDASFVAQQARIAELSEKVRLQNASLDMDRQLLAANRDIRELMGARNLHITDVHDFDGHGKQAKVFGRIFYTQGKSLIFYAFDLGDKRLENAKYSFQAWGQQEGKQNSARSLGLMYQDDKAQKRWVLKVDDPNLLRQIDSVFVTVEPAGGGKKPTGQKLLYAYVGNEPNHP